MEERIEASRVKPTFTGERNSSFLLRGLHIEVLAKEGTRSPIETRTL